MDYFKKYLKYKSKYLQEKVKYGGSDANANIVVDTINSKTNNLN